MAQTVSWDRAGNWTMTGGGGLSGLGRMRDVLSRHVEVGTTAYADPEEGLVGVMLTQTAMDSADTPRLHQDFWTTAYQN